MVIDARRSARWRDVRAFVRCAAHGRRICGDRPAPATHHRRRTGANREASRDSCRRGALVPRLPRPVARPQPARDRRRRRRKAGWTAWLIASLTRRAASRAVVRRRGRTAARRRRHRAGARSMRWFAPCEPRSPSARSSRRDSALRRAVVRLAGPLRASVWGRPLYAQLDRGCWRRGATLDRRPCAALPRVRRAARRVRCRGLAAR